MFASGWKEATQRGEALNTNRKLQTRRFTTHTHTSFRAMCCSGLRVCHNCIVASQIQKFRCNHPAALTPQTAELSDRTCLCMPRPPQSTAPSLQACASAPAARLSRAPARRTIPAYVWRWWKLPMSGLLEVIGLPRSDRGDVELSPT